jgi:uncharacterized protein (TIGR03790 family)
LASNIRMTWARVSILLVSVLAMPVWGAGPGDEVIIVFNSRVPLSKGVAEYYAQKRQVPKSQIFGFDLTASEEISRVEFRDSLQRPLMKALSNKKLWQMATRNQAATNGQPAHAETVVVSSKIRYAVLCYGVPLKILEDPKQVDDAAANLRPEMRRNEACVDSELALLPWNEARLPLSGPLRNPVQGLTNAAQLNPTHGVLMVARLDGPSPEIARGLVDKAIQADQDGLWGRAYFDLRNISDPGYKIGDDWIRSAGEICRHLGFETVFDNNAGTFPAGFPMSQIGLYLGWYAENADGPFALPQVEFMPGAFAYHLHSFSAVTLRLAHYGWVAPFLAKGATATMGCVYEPYLTGTPDVAVFMARFVYSGFSFGEAAYASQPVLSWMTTVVGDPLYRPFQQSPEALERRLQQTHSPLLPWYYLRVTDVNLANGKPLAEGIAYLEGLELTKKSAVLEEKLGDLYWAQGKPSSAVQTYAEALKLDPSPLQRLRLRLGLAEKLLALDREADAYQDLQNLLEEMPEYPDRVPILRRLLPLARKLDRTTDAQKYEAALNAAAGHSNP